MLKKSHTRIVHGTHDSLYTGSIQQSQENALHWSHPCVQNVAGIVLKYA